MSSQGATQIRITCAGVRMGIGRSGKRGATYVSITGSPDVLVAQAEGVAWPSPFALASSSFIGRGTFPSLVAA